MSVQLWLRENDRGLLGSSSIDFSPYTEGIVSGVGKDGCLGKAGHQFVLGRFRVLENLDGDRTEIVSFRGNSVYSRGIMTPNSWVNTAYHRKKFPNSWRRNGILRVEMIHVHPHDDVVSAFETYYRSYDVKKRDERDNHFLLYKIETILV